MPLGAPLLCHSPKPFSQPCSHLELQEGRGAPETVILNAVPYKINCCVGNEWERGTWQGLLLESKAVLKSNGKSTSWREGRQSTAPHV